MADNQPYVKPAPIADTVAAHKVTWVAVDDWHAIYVDGVLMGEQSHSLSPWTWIEVLQALGAEVEDLRYEPIAEELAEDLGRFPEAWPPEHSDGGGS